MDVYSDARARGLVPEFFDAGGEHRITPPAALKVILDGLPPPVPRRYFRGPVVLRHGRDDFVVDVGGGAYDLTWRLVENERALAQGALDGSSIRLPAELPIGSYRLDLFDQAQQTIESALVLIAPQHAYVGSLDRVWLLTVQLYSLASAHNWGVGDFSDLARLIDVVAPLGCAGIGLSPLHALFDDHPSECSPYAPNSRLFLNPLYIDVEVLPESVGIGDAVDRDAIAREKSQPLIDYPLVADRKFKALRRAFDIFRTKGAAERRAAFDRFRRERGPALARFACFEVLRHKLTAPWWEWPAEWRQPDDERIDLLRHGSDRVEIEFVEFVQWCAHVQLQNCVDLAKSCGMPIGLYLDVAVGVQAGGFDAWSHQQAIAHNLAVGAPPDPLNTAGQDWGVAGFAGQGLSACDFVPFRDTLRASLRYAGAIRLDHILGLNRLYLVPSGFSPRDGAYIEMPLCALLAVVAQESAAYRCVIVGEDLGTVPEGFRDTLADWGIFSYRVMLFERGANGAFLPADAYTADALVTFNTHDLASFAGWRSSHDLATKRTLGIDPGESDEARSAAHRALDERLSADGISRHDFLGAVEFLARTPARLLAVALDDVLGLADQPNIPGTVDEHPNWRRRLPIRVEQLAAKLGADLKRGIGSHRDSLIKA